MSETVRRPWWRRARWRVAAAVWLSLPVLWFAVDAGVAYGSGRGWWRYPREFYSPFDRAIDHWGPPPVRDAYYSFHLWALGLGSRHAKAGREAGE